MSVIQVFDCSDQFGGNVSVNYLNVILCPNEMIESIHTALCIFGLTRVDKTILSVQIFENQGNLFPPETLFHVLLDDDMITNDVVTKHLSLNTFLAAFATSVWSHHSCTLTCSAIYMGSWESA